MQKISRGQIFLGHAADAENTSICTNFSAFVLIFPYFIKIIPLCWKVVQFWQFSKPLLTNLHIKLLYM